MSCYPDFEWFYFDLHSPEGYDIICTIHPHPFNSVFTIAIFDVYIYKDNKVLLHHFFALPATPDKQEDQPFLLAYDNSNYIKKTDDKVEVVVKDNVLDLKMTLTDQLKIVNPVRNKLVQDPAVTGAFDWVVYAPLCKAQADIRWEENHLSLSGRGYHDYNAGSGNLKETLKYWYWGKFFFNNELYIYGDIITKNQARKTIALHVSETGAAFDNQPEMIKKENQVCFKSHGRSFEFSLDKVHKIDEIIFFMTKLSRRFLVVVKVLEVFNHLCSKFKAGQFLRKILSNSRYVRYRQIGKTTKGDPLTCFYEEMFL